MTIDAKTVDEYISKVPEERKDAISRLRKTVSDNLPKGFEEGINYKMIGFYVPHSIYPNGYHCNPSLPLPFMNIGNQKNYISLYHMGIYGEGAVNDWFIEEWPKHSNRKLGIHGSSKCKSSRSSIPTANVENMPRSTL